MESILIKIIQHGLGKNGWVRILLTTIARFGYFLFIIYGLVEWFRPGPVTMQIQRRRSLLYCLFSVTIGSLISFIMGRLYFRPRPFVADRRVEPLIGHKENASFPSNHTALSFTVALQLLRHHSWAGVVFLGGSLLIGFSRIYSGVHYVTDILAGFLLGFASHIIVVKSSWAGKLAGHICYYYAIIETFFKKWNHL